MEHVPGPANSAVHLPGTAARALPMPRISLASQVGPGSTPQRAALAHPGQQQRLLPPARFTSAFARPPAPRSQSPLRRLAERSTEFTASQPPFAFPSTQEELQVCYMLCGDNVGCTLAQTCARPRGCPKLKAVLKPCSNVLPLLRQHNTAHRSSRRSRRSLSPASMHLRRHAAACQRIQEAYMRSHHRQPCSWPLKARQCQRTIPGPAPSA